MTSHGTSRSTSPVGSRAETVEPPPPLAACARPLGAVDWMAAAFGGGHAQYDPHYNAQCDESARLSGSEGRYCEQQ
jgi:hypothetical protein